MFFYESEILQCLEFNTSRILTIDFLNYFAFDANFEMKGRRYFYSLYLLNISYHNLKLRSISKSQLAFSIIYFVNKIFGKGDQWPPEKTDSSISLKNRKTKKTVFLNLKEKLKTWNDYKSEYHENFISYTDKITRIGDVAPKIISKMENDRFLSKISNKLIDENLKYNCLAERYSKENGKHKNLVSSNGSKSSQKENICQLLSVPRDKNTNNGSKGQSTGLTSYNLRSNLPRSKISCFQIPLGKNVKNIKDYESRSDDSLKSGQRDTFNQPNTVKTGLDIQFDFSKIKSIAMDVFLGNKLI